MLLLDVVDKISWRGPDNGGKVLYSCSIGSIHPPIKQPWRAEKDGAMPPPTLRVFSGQDSNVVQPPTRMTKAQRKQQRQRQPSHDVGYALVERLQGVWNHSFVPSGVVVRGTEAVIGGVSYQLEVSREGIQVVGWLLEEVHWSGDVVNWQQPETGHRCTWMRKLPSRTHAQRMTPRSPHETSRHVPPPSPPAASCCWFTNLFGGRHRASKHSTSSPVSRESQHHESPSLVQLELHMNGVRRQPSHTADGSQGQERGHEDPLSSPLVAAALPKAASAPQFSPPIRTTEGRLEHESGHEVSFSSPPVAAALPQAAPAPFFSPPSYEEACTQHKPRSPRVLQ